MDRFPLSLLFEISRSLFGRAALFCVSACLGASVGISIGLREVRFPWEVAGWIPMMFLASVVGVVTLPIPLIIIAGLACYLRSSEARHWILLIPFFLTGGLGASLASLFASGVG
jgi:hypothetical protein